MFDKLPFKKQYLLPVGIVIMLIACYQFAFKKTFVAWQLNRQLNKQVTISVDQSIQPLYLIRKNKNLSNILALYRTDTAGFRNTAINEIAEIAQKENVKLSDVPSTDPIYNADHAVIQKVELEGEYFSLERVLMALQKATDLGRIRSLTYQKIKLRTESEDKQRLYLNVFFESVK